MTLIFSFFFPSDLVESDSFSLFFFSRMQDCVDCIVFSMSFFFLLYRYGAAYVLGMPAAPFFPLSFVTARRIRTPKSGSIFFSCPVPRQGSKSCAACLSFFFFSFPLLAVDCVWIQKRVDRFFFLLPYAQNEPRNSVHHAPPRPFFLSSFLSSRHAPSLRMRDDLFFPRTVSSVSRNLHASSFLHPGARPVASRLASK